MAGRNYNGSPGNSNLMFDLGPMFQGLDGMRDQRDQGRQRRANAIYLNRVRAGLEDPYGQSDFQYQPSYTQSMASRPWGGQQQEDQYGSDYAQTAPTGQQYAYVAGASKPIDMNPQKSAYELLAQRYANQMMDATNPANVAYKDVSLPDGGFMSVEDPNNTFNQQRQQSLTALSNMFNPNRQTGTRSTAEQMALDNNRAMNAQDALKMKNDLDMLAARAKKDLGYTDAALEWAKDIAKSDLTFWTRSRDEQDKKFAEFASSYGKLYKSQTPPATQNVMPTAQPTGMSVSGLDAGTTVPLNQSQSVPQAKKKTKEGIPVYEDIKGEYIIKDGVKYYR